jgi:hypothetical protein
LIRRGPSCQRFGVDRDSEVDELIDAVRFCAAALTDPATGAAVPVKPGRSEGSGRSRRTAADHCTPKKHVPLRRADPPAQLLATRPWMRSSSSGELRRVRRETVQRVGRRPHSIRGALRDVRGRITFGLHDARSLLHGTLASASNDRFSAANRSSATMCGEMGGPQTALFRTLGRTSPIFHGLGWPWLAWIRLARGLPSPVFGLMYKSDGLGRRLKTYNGIYVT